MLVSVTLTRRFGRRLPPRELGQPLVGELSLLKIDYRGQLGTIDVLRLQRPNNATEAGRLAELFEPRLVTLHSGLMVFRGFESIDHAGVIQEWRCAVITGADAEKSVTPS